MIKTINCFETVDGQIFKSYDEAQQHDIKLNRGAYISRLHFLEKQQRLKKKKLRETSWRALDADMMKYQRELQREVECGKYNLRQLLMALKQKKTCR